MGPQKGTLIPTQMRITLIMCCFLSLTGSGLILWLNLLGKHTSACREGGGALLSFRAASSQLLRANVTQSRVFVGVLSRSGSTAARQAIRATWGADGRLARVMFFTLRPESEQAFKALRAEAAAHGDLVVASEARESYYNATHSVVAMMRVAAGMGDKITHVLKTDEDCYVRIHLLLQTLAALPRQWLYAGRIEHVQVNRDPKYRWYVPVANWPSNETITYTWGMATVLSQDLVRHLAAGAVHVSMPANNMLWVEDLAVGVWVAQVAKEQNAAVSYSSIKCSAEACQDDDVVTANLQSPLEALHCLHESNGQCCGAPTVVRESNIWAPAKN